MNPCQQIILFATYNEWMNLKVYEAAGRLTPQELAADRRGYFGSILGTLNHLIVADTVWLKRFTTHPADFTALEPVKALPTPTALNEIVCADFASLSARRRLLDGVIKEWVPSLTEQDLNHTFRYASMKGIVSQKRFGDLLLHFFNHQTHHRGQATTLLTQAGQDVGATDLLLLIPNIEIDDVAETIKTKNFG